VFREKGPLAGASDRAIFVIDKTGRIGFGKVYPVTQVPDLQEVLNTLRA